MSGRDNSNQDKTCNCDRLRDLVKINGFNSPKEYRELLEQLESDKRMAKFTPSNSNRKFGEVCFKCLICNEVWIIVQPDYPIRGYFGKLEWYR